MSENNMILDMLDSIDEKYLDNYFLMKEKSHTNCINKKQSSVHKQWLIAAACFCLCIGLVFGSGGLWAIYRNAKTDTESEVGTNHESKHEQTSIYTPPIPTGKALPLEMVSGVFEGQYFSSDDTPYVPVFYSSSRHLPLSDIPQDGQATVYKKNPQYKALDRDELASFAEALLPKLSNSLGNNHNEWSGGNIYENSLSAEDSYLRSSYRSGQYEIVLDQYSGGTGIHAMQSHTKVKFNPYRISMRDNDVSIIFNSKVVMINQRQTEEQIVDSLEWVKEILFYIFDCHMDSAKVIFNYSASSPYSSELSSIEVIYYNSADQTTSQRKEFSPNICIKFRNYGNTSSDFLKYADITYSFPRTEKPYYTPMEDYNLISLEDAEQLLYNGHSFDGGGYTFRSDKEIVMFDSYDYVGYEYVHGYQYAIPFYTFYKRIGFDENGNVKYAKTFVCAVEVQYGG